MEVCSVSGDVIICDEETTHCMAQCFSDEYAELIADVLNARDAAKKQENRMTTWLKDANGNKCSVEYFGTKEEAQKALDSLVDCKNCTNCSRCSDCSRCSGCSGCSGCSECSGCSDCSDCSNIAWLDDKKDLNGDPDAPVWQLGQPAIPVIGNIHTKVYEVASVPEGALDMGEWHKCNTTHCRAGWVVHLAGEAGYALERFHDTLLAAQLIYRESGYLINPCRFYDGNTAALADMKALAEGEAAVRHIKAIEVNPELMERVR